MQDSLRTYLYNTNVSKDLSLLKTKPYRDLSMSNMLVVANSQELRRHFDKLQILVCGIHVNCLLP